MTRKAAVIEPLYKGLEHVSGRVAARIYDGDTPTHTSYLFDPALLDESVRHPGRLVWIHLDEWPARLSPRTP